MSFIRYSVELAFKEPIDPALNGLLTAMEATIRQAKPHAVKINEGLPDEEDTTEAVWHICHHDATDVICEPKQEI